MKFGVFMGPFHRVGENPTLAIDRDLELVQWLDYLALTRPGSGSTTVPAGDYLLPGDFIAAAAERTRHIKLAPGWLACPTTIP